MIDFAALQSAVKPKARTDQYVVLSALYHLGAHEHPVTARNVADLLRLNLGKKAPENVSACLRAYKDYVQPVEKWPPLQWKLTSTGLDRLAQYWRRLIGVEMGTYVIGEGSIALAKALG